MALKPGATFLTDPSGGSAVKSGGYDLFVVQRNRNPQHNSPTGNKSPVRHGCTALAVCTLSTDDPMLKDVLNPGGGNPVVRVLA